MMKPCDIHPQRIQQQNDDEGNKERDRPEREESDAMW